MEELIGKIVLLKQPNVNFSFDPDSPFFEDKPLWAYCEVLLVEIINDGTQATVRHPCGLNTYPDIENVFRVPTFEPITK